MYVDESTFRDLTIFPPASLDEILDATPGFLDAHLAEASDYIDARLRKRYAVPFASPAPRIVARWVVRMVTRECFLRRGIDPLDPQWVSIDAQATTAEAEIKEAAESELGLFDLPLAADSASSALAGPRPLSYREHSPYVWRDRQVRAGRADDGRGRGR